MSSSYTFSNAYFIAHFGLFVLAGGQILSRISLLVSFCTGVHFFMVFYYAFCELTKGTARGFQLVLTVGCLFSGQSTENSSNLRVLFFKISQMLQVKQSQAWQNGGQYLCGTVTTVKEFII
jgi:hypothetical protein